MSMYRGNSSVTNHLSAQLPENQAQGSVTLPEQFSPLSTSTPRQASQIEYLTTMLTSTQHTLLLQQQKISLLENDLRNVQGRLQELERQQQLAANHVSTGMGGSASLSEQVKRPKVPSGLSVSHAGQNL